MRNEMPIWARRSKLDDVVRLRRSVLVGARDLRMKIAVMAARRGATYFLREAQGGMIPLGSVAVVLLSR